MRGPGSIPLTPVTGLGKMVVVTGPAGRGGNITLTTISSGIMAWHGAYWSEMENCVYC